MNREINGSVALRWSLAGCALAEAMRGHADRARAAEAQLAAMAPAKTMPMMELSSIHRAGPGSASARRTVQGQGETRPRAADPAGRRRGLRIGEARLRHDIARLGHPGQVAPRLAESSAAQVDGELVPALAAHAAALAERKATSKRPGSAWSRSARHCSPPRRSWPQRRGTGWPDRPARPPP